MSSPNSPSFTRAIFGKERASSPRMMLSHSRSSHNVLEGSAEGLPFSNSPPADTPAPTPTQAESTTPAGIEIPAFAHRKSIVLKKDSATKAAQALKHRATVSKPSTSVATDQNSQPDSGSVSVSVSQTEQQTSTPASTTPSTTPPSTTPLTRTPSESSDKQRTGSESTPPTTPTTRTPSNTTDESNKPTNQIRFTLDEEKEKLKEEKEVFREEVVTILRELKIEQLTIGVSVRMFTKSKPAGLQGVCKLSKDRKFVQFYEGANLSSLEPGTNPTEQIIINALSAIEPSLSPTLDPALTTALNRSKDLFDQALMFTLTFKDTTNPAIVLSLASRSDFSSWLDGLACLMGTTLTSSVQLKSDIELMCEVLALDKLYPTPALPPLPPPELMSALQ